MRHNRLFLCIMAWLTLIFISCQNKPDLSVKKIRETGIEDFLLRQLALHKILVIPECLSHDSYDGIRLPLNLIRRWIKADHNIKKLFVGLEREVDNEELELIQNNSYYQYKRFATFCPPGWALFSTKGLSEYLFYQEVKEEYPDKFNIFGFENSYLYYDSTNNRYLLPSQIDTIENVKTVPYSKSQAPFIIMYIYSRFFRDYRSFSTIQQMMEDNPDACFIILIGNAHTSKGFYFEESDIDRQIMETYKIDKERYWHTVGYFLKQNYDPLFIQSNVDTTVCRETLFRFDPDNPDTVRHKFFLSFYTDYIYSIPQGVNTNTEEQPLVGVPSVRNFEILASKNFQIYPDQQHVDNARKLIYFMTGVLPEIKLDEPGGTAACTFLDPRTGRPLKFEKYNRLILNWYLDGTFVQRLNEDVAAYDSRCLFKAIFKLMDKADPSPLSEQQGKLFIDYLLALLSVLGSEEEQSFARSHLSQKFGDHHDYYQYYKRFYYGQYSLH